MGTPETPSYRQRIGYQAILLGGFSMLAAVMLVSGNIATKDAIQERMQEDLRLSLSQVIPAETHDNDLLSHPLLIPQPDNKPLTVYRGTEGMQVSSLAFEIVGQGYAGEIRLIMGLDNQGHILGVRVLSHAETPGLGDKIEEAKDDWILGFNRLGLDLVPDKEWAVKKDGGRFDQFSGATITPRAVVAAIKGGLQFFEANRTELLVTPSITEMTVTQE